MQKPFLSRNWEKLFTNPTNYLFHNLIGTTTKVTAAFFFIHCPHVVWDHTAGKLFNKNPEIIPDINNLITDDGKNPVEEKCRRLMTRWERKAEIWESFAKLGLIFM